MLEKIYDKYKDRLNETEITKVVLAELEVEINRQLRVDISDQFKELSVSQLLKIKAELASGMKDDEGIRRESSDRQDVRLAGKQVPEGSYGELCLDEEGPPVDGE